MEYIVPFYIVSIRIRKTSPRDLIEHYEPGKWGLTFKFVKITCLSVFIHIETYIYIYVYICICVYAYTCVYVYEYVYQIVCIHLYSNINVYVYHTRAKGFYF